MKETIIQANGNSINYWRDLWNFKRLLYFLAWRDMSVRYRQTIIGILWSVLQPSITMSIFILIFHKVAKLPSIGDTPYPIMVFSALLPWQFFANSVNQCSISIISNPGIISKVYFPRMIIPISSMLVCLVDFFLAFILLMIMMFFYSYLPSYNIIFIPFFLFMSFILAAGIGLFFSALMVRYRDFRILVPFLIQIGLYITPIGFSSAIVPEWLRFWYSLNPMVGIIEGFRWCIIGGEANIYMPGFISSLILTGLIFFMGISIFRKLENTFADFI